jgi:hypothetical protein
MQASKPAQFCLKHLEQRCEEVCPKGRTHIDINKPWPAEVISFVRVFHKLDPQKVKDEDLPAFVINFAKAYQAKVDAEKFLAQLNSLKESKPESQPKQPAKQQHVKQQPVKQQSEKPQAVLQQAVNQRPAKQQPVKQQPAKKSSDDTKLAEMISMAVAAAMKQQAPKPQKVLQPTMAQVPVFSASAGGGSPPPVWAPYPAPVSAPVRRVAKLSPAETPCSKLDCNGIFKFPNGKEVKCKYLH